MLLLKHVALTILFCFLVDRWVLHPQTLETCDSKVSKNCAWNNEVHIECIGYVKAYPSYRTFIDNRNSWEQIIYRNQTAQSDKLFLQNQCLHVIQSMTTHACNTRFGFQGPDHGFHHSFLGVAGMIIPMDLFIAEINTWIILLFLLHSGNSTTTDSWLLSCFGLAFAGLGRLWNWKSNDWIIRIMSYNLY